MSNSVNSNIPSCKQDLAMDESDSRRLNSNKVAIGLGASTTICLALFLFAGCTQSTLRDLPSFLSYKSKGPSFAELSQSETTKLTIWHESLEEAQAASLESGKPILADFTGSDWCTWCIKLKKDVFETPEFKSWASENVTLLELDYPKRGIQSPAIRKQNSELKDRYAIQGYPTVLLLDDQGEIMGKLGYMKTPTEWIAKAESFLRKSAQP